MKVVDRGRRVMGTAALALLFTLVQAIVTVHHHDGKGGHGEAPLHACEICLFAATQPDDVGLPPADAGELEPRAILSPLNWAAQREINPLAAFWGADARAPPSWSVYR